MAAIAAPADPHEAHRPTQTHAEVTRDVLGTLGTPGRGYYLALFGAIAMFLVGLGPDVSAIRDKVTGWRKTIYGLCSVGWTGADSQWRHYTRGYLYLAALATPLVLSVHSVVSWDFAMAIVPG